MLRPLRGSDAALAAVGLVSGFASGLLGIGGGTVVTPLLSSGVSDHVEWCDAAEHQRWYCLDFPPNLEKFFDRGFREVFAVVTSC